MSKCWIPRANFESNTLYPIYGACFCASGLCPDTNDIPDDCGDWICRDKVCDLAEGCPCMSEVSATRGRAYTGWLGNQVKKVTACRIENKNVRKSRKVKETWE